jgi:hypothetical protein
MVTYRDQGCALPLLFQASRDLGNNLSLTCFYSKETTLRLNNQPFTNFFQITTSIIALNREIIAQSQRET